MSYHNRTIYIYDEAQKAETVLSAVSYIYIYIYIYLWHGLDDSTCVRSPGVAIWPYLHPSISTAQMRPRRPKQYCLQLVTYIYIYIYHTSNASLSWHTVYLKHFYNFTNSAFVMPSTQNETSLRRRDE